MADAAASVLARLKNKAKAAGISTQIIGKIKNVRVPFNVDIGVGDVIIPCAKQQMIHTQLPDPFSVISQHY